MHHDASVMLYNTMGQASELCVIVGRQYKMSAEAINLFRYEQ